MRWFVVLAPVSLVLASACQAPAPRPSAPPAGRSTPTATGGSRPVGSTPVGSTGAVEPEPATAPVARAPQRRCLPGMVHVAVDFCPEMERRCLREEYEPSNHLTICHRFAVEQRCLAERRPLSFCIDRFEAPNEAGARPTRMVTWHQARQACQAGGKRLCTEDEWVAACEGPEELPFPGGRRRRPERCHIDQPWRSPNLKKLYSKRPGVSDAEVDRLDQGRRFSMKPGCDSGFGVADMTGNLDEWTRASGGRGRRHPAVLKGGAWGHVRNACRPATTSHTAGFSYYFVGYRCCRDTDGE